MSRFHANNGEYDEWRTAETFDGWKATDSRADAAYDLDATDYQENDR